MPGAVVSLSGGLDSAVCMGMANDEGYDITAVSFRYGQTHAVEVERASRIAELYGAYHMIIDLPNIFAGSDSVLVAANKLDMPEMSYEEIDKTPGVSPTYVPYRNGNLLSMAATVALTFSADFVYAGMHAEDAAGWAYPDCTPEFLGAMANAIWVGTYHKVRLVAPLQWMDKSEIVRWAVMLDVPVEETMSCYKGESPACGTCPTCVGRIQAFKRAGFIDPIPYAIDIDWGEG